MTAKKETKGPEFISELRSNGGFVNKACIAINVSKQAVYNWRDSDPTFAQQWDDAINIATEELEAECRRRAYEGILEPVFYQGKECGQIRRYSDTLLIFQLKALKPERYREQIKFITQPEAEKVVDDAIQKHNLPARTTVVDSTM